MQFLSLWKNLEWKSFLVATRKKNLLQAKVILGSWENEQPAFVAEQRKFPAQKRRELVGRLQSDETFYFISQLRIHQTAYMKHLFNERWFNAEAKRLEKCAKRFITQRERWHWNLSRTFRWRQRNIISFKQKCIRVTFVEKNIFERNKHKTPPRFIVLTLKVIFAARCCFWCVITFYSAQGLHVCSHFLLFPRALCVIKFSEAARMSPS